jgi:hypothetical protein
MKNALSVGVTVLKVTLGLWNIMGASYMAFNYTVLATTTAQNALPAEFWYVLAVLQILGALGLILSVFRHYRHFGSFSASALLLYTFLGFFLYESYQGFHGMLWGIIPIALLTLIAYKTLNNETPHPTV